MRRSRAYTAAWSLAYLVALQGLTGCATMRHLGSNIFNTDAAEAVGTDLIASGNPILASLGSIVFAAAVALKGKRKMQCMLEARRRKQELLWPDKPVEPSEPPLTPDQPLS